MDEFPNDNRALWSHEELFGDGSDIEVVESLEFEAVPEGDVELRLEPEHDTDVGPEVVTAPDPFMQLVRILGEVVRENGGGALAPIVAKVLGVERVDDGIPEATVEALVAGGMLERCGAGSTRLARTESLTKTAGAWSRVLRGESEDMADCGPRTLDEWAADVAARVIASPARTEQLRRELRRRGVAAFGLLQAA